MLKNIEAAASALSDPTRLRIVKLLAVRDLCVCQLEYLLDAGQSRISQNLSILKYADLVTDTRNGRTVFYSLNREAFAQAVHDLQSLFGEPALDGLPELEQEAQRWRRMPAELAAICPAAETPAARAGSPAAAGAATSIANEV